MRLNAVFAQQIQKIVQFVPVFADFSDFAVAIDGITCQKARRFPHRPLDGMQPIAAARKMRCADIFACRNQILDSDGNHRAERNRKAFARFIEKRMRFCCDMQIDGITAHADAIVEIGIAVR